MTVSKPLDMTHLIEQLGGFGTYQKWIFALACYCGAMPGIMVVNLAFVGYEPSFRCMIPSCDTANSTYNEDFLNFTTPYNPKKKMWDQCDSYQEFGAANDSIVDDSSCEEANFDQMNKLNCSSYIYDDSLFTSSIVTEFNLVCRNSWKQPAASSGYMVGMLFGAFVLGDLADRIGRKKGLVVSASIFFIGSVVSSLAQNYYTFLASRVVIGAGSAAMFQIAFILALEFVSPSWRTFVGILIEIPFALGEASVALFAYYIRDWRWLQAMCTAPTLFVLTYYWLMPESIRWLVSRGNTSEALKVVKRFEKINKITVSEEVYHALNLKEKPEIYAVDVPSKDTTDGIGHSQDSNLVAEERNVLDLLRFPNTRKRTLNLIFCWIVVTLAYYGLSANSANLGGNLFVNFVAIMLIEVPSYLFAFLVLDRMGRKGSLCFCMILGGVASLLAGATPESLHWLIVTFSMLGKFGISAGFAVVYVYTAEIFPTSYRSIGLGTCSMSARVGGILAPFIANLGKIYKSLPLFIFGVLGVASGILLILLPETLGSDLPQTLEESENFGTDQSIFYFSCWSNKKKISICEPNKKYSENNIS